MGFLQRASSPKTNSIASARHCWPNPVVETSRKTNRLGGFVAVAFGVAGMLLAAAAAVVAILFTSGANSTVDDVVERITDPVERLDQRVTEATAAIDSADGSELDARITGIVDQTSAVRGGIDTVTEHPLYAALPIDTDPFGATVDSIEDHGASLVSSTTVDLTEDGRGEIADELDKISGALTDVDATVEDLAGSLRFWIRLSGLAFLLLSLWGFVAQLSLVQWGRKLSSTSPSSS